MSLNTDILFWFRVNQSVLFLLNDACLAEKQQIPIFIVFGLTRPGLESTSYRTQSGTLTITPPMRFEYEWWWNQFICFSRDSDIVVELYMFPCEMQYFVIMITPALVLFEQETDNAWINVWDIRSLIKI